MRIGIDARLWNQTGVGRYIRNLVINLQNIDNKNEYVIFLRSQDIEVAKKTITNKNWKIETADIRWHSLSEQYKLLNILNKENLDLVHFPYFSVPVFYNKPYVVTIHDLIIDHFPTGEASTLPFLVYKLKLLGYKYIIHTASKKAKKLIAVSQSTRNEIIDHLRIDKNKISVIYEGVDEFSKSSSKNSNLDNYFLFVGNVYPHKNANLLVDAFKIFSKNEIHKLVFVGKEDYFYKKLKERIKKEELSGKIIFLGEVDDASLSGLYKNAIALIRPSFMEGFSLPPLEAMANECLVLASDIEVHREFFKNGVIYFDPNNVNDIVRVLNEAISINPSSKEKIIEEAVEKTKQFSWEKAAKETLKVYESSTSASSA